MPYTKGMNKHTYYRAASLIFTLLAVAHGARIFYGWEAEMGGYTIPVEASWVMLGIAGYLAVRGWQFAQYHAKGAKKR